VEVSWAGSGGSAGDDTIRDSTSTALHRLVECRNGGRSEGIRVNFLPRSNPFTGVYVHLTLKTLRPES
jgi:hypothetical protein